LATPSQQNGTYRPGIPLLDQRPSHSGSRACDREIVCCFTSLPRDLASTSRMAGLWWDLLVWTGPLMTPRYSPIGIPCGIRISPFWISGPATTALCRLLNAITIAFRPRFPPRQGRAWQGRPGWFGIPPPVPIVGVFSSTLLPGFIGPESSVLPADLPPSATSPPWDLLRGSALCRLRQPSTTGQEGFPG